MKPGGKKKRGACPVHRVFWTIESICFSRRMENRHCFPFLLAFGFRRLFFFYRKNLNHGWRSTFVGRSPEVTPSFIANYGFLC
jgi:hypothetical protein